MRNQIVIDSVSESELRVLIAEVVGQLFEKFLSINSGKEPFAELLTREETAKRLGVTLPTLHKWTLDGTIRGKRIGSRIRYCAEDVAASLEDIHHVKSKRR
jgi:excisionase family DNA binding protein